MNTRLVIGIVLMLLGIGSLLGGTGALSRGHAVPGTALLAVAVFTIALAWRALVPAKEVPPEKESE